MIPSWLTSTPSVREGYPRARAFFGGYVILDVLVPEGLIAVKKTKDGSIHFLFESLPPDPIPSLVCFPRQALTFDRLLPAMEMRLSKGNASNRIGFTARQTSSSGEPVYSDCGSSSDQTRPIP